MATDQDYGLTPAADSQTLSQFSFNPQTNTVRSGGSIYTPGTHDPGYGLAPAQNQPPSIADDVKQNPWRVFQIPLQHAASAASGKAETIGSQMLKDAAAGKDISKADYLKQFGYNVTSDTAKFVSGMLSPEGMGVAAATALAPEVMGPALILHGGYKLATGPISLKPEDVQNTLSSLSEMAGGGAVTAGAFNGSPTPLQDAWKSSRYKLQRLSGAMLTPQEAAQVPAGTQFAPPRQVSNQDVINEAGSEGIDLTPSQATTDRVARFVQGVGEQTLTPGGDSLQQALELNKGKLGQSVENFAMRNDPHVLGASPESAGTDLQSQAKIALEVAKDNAAIAYKQAGADQANIAVDVRNPLQDFIDSQRNVRQPKAAVSQPEYKSPAVEAALQDIEDKIADPRLGPNASVQSVRNLRTEFWEKGNDYTGTIPDAAKGIYKQASQIADSSMMNAAQGTPFEQSFRDASQQWADLKSKFDTPGEPLYKLLQTSDPKQAYNAIAGTKSAADILKLKDAGVDLAPIRGQVIRDIANKGFRSTGNTLAGYPDSFLQSLFGPQGARELYVKSEIGRRLNFEANPSGSGRLLIAKDQMGWNPANWVRGESAALLSMPRNPSSFVSPAAQPSPGFASLGPRPLSMRALLGGASASEGGAGQ